MSRIKYLIWRPDYSETVGDAHEFESTETDIETVGQQYAEYYWDNLDGWGSSWPIEFHIADTERNLLGVVRVEMEYQSVFYGRKVKP